MTNKSSKRQTKKKDRRMKKGRKSEDSTQVVKFGLDLFTTADSTFPESVETRESMEDEISAKKQKREKKDGRFYKFVKRHFLQRKSSSNDVKEIRIVPDGDECKWARRSAGSAASRSSNETSGSEGDRLEVVHDMAEEYIPEV